ncbi:MAG: sugar phosphate isomerase/epimerase [Clostridia bacterium]|nr:sugar phosphate isomerase/epimerase [Clostridia bacterium]
MISFPIAYQLYSARDEAQRDLVGTLRQIAEMGYDGIELAGLYGHDAAEVKSLLDSLGLRAISSHVPLADIRRDMFKVISEHLRLGCEYIAVPYLDEQTRPGAEGFAGALNTIYKFGFLCREAGLQLLYHNHDFEFVNLSGMYGFDFLYEAVPEDLLKLEPDVCWINYAGENPAQYIRKYSWRCPVIHLKDYVGVKGDASPYALIGIDEGEKKKDAQFEFKPIGYGIVDIAAVLEASVEAGAHWIVVEQDESVGATPLEAAKLSINALKEKYGVKSIEEGLQ